MNIRIILTIIAALLFSIGKGILETIYSPITGALTAAQLDDTVSSYTAAKLVREGNASSVLFWLLVIAILIIWSKPLLRLLVLGCLRHPNTRLLRKRSAHATVIVLAAMQASCMKPPKIPDVVEVKSNETAWAIPLDGSSSANQVKFNSVSFLDQKKVASKRIWIDKVEKKIGRFDWEIEWIPATRVITVDRSLVTRQWTDSDTGTSKDDQGVGVVTKDSVKLRVGLTVTASIDEDDASTYLYYHGARPLSQVLDQNIRSFAVAELTRDYSELTLSEAQTKGDTIYKALFDSARKAFKPKGVTIQYLGNAEGLTYADPTVQNAINARYLAEQSVKTAEQEQNAQKIRNATLVMNAQTEAEAAEKLLAAKEAATFKNELNIKTMAAQAGLNMSARWNGQMPANILPSNSPLLMQLGSK